MWQEKRAAVGVSGAASTMSSCGWSFTRFIVFFLPTVLLTRLPFPLYKNVFCTVLRLYLARNFLGSMPRSLRTCRPLPLWRSRWNCWALLTGHVLSCLPLPICLDNMPSRIRLPPWYTYTCYQCTLPSMCHPSEKRTLLGGIFRASHECLLGSYLEGVIIQYHVHWVLFIPLQVEQPVSGAFVSWF